MFVIFAMDITGEKTDLKQKKSLLEILWFSRTKLEKRLIVTATLFLIVLLCVALIYVFLSKKSEICTSSSCLETSMGLLNQIDFDANPCHDFYRFACGNFLKNTNLERERFRTAPDIMQDEIKSRIKNLLERPVHSRQPRSFNLAKQFYRACMNESAIKAEGVKWMKQIFRRMGGWPTLEEDDWDEGGFDWKRSVHKLRQMGINFQFFIALAVVKDEERPTRYVLQLSDPYKQHSQIIGEDIKRTYLQYMEDVAVYFGSTLVNARLDQQDVLAFTLALAKISRDGRKNNMSNLYNPYVLSELQFQFSSINWYEYISGMLSPTVELKYDDVVHVPDPYYLQELEHLMLNTSRRVLGNFMAWHTLQHFIHFMPSDLISKAYDYMEIINGELARRPRWEVCVDVLKDRMGPVVSNMYLEEHFDDETRTDVAVMVESIKRQMKKTVDDFQWIDDETRKLTRDKLLDITADIMSYDDMRSLIQLSRSFDDVKIYHDNILLSVLNLDQFSLNAKFRKLRDPVTANWLEDPDFVTGLEIVPSTHEDILVFPMGILDGIYYSKTRPAYSNFGALGSVIGQKIWQSYIGIKHNKSRNITKNLWTPSTLLKYEERLKCLEGIFRRSINRFLPDEVFHAKSREDDLALLIGVKVAYDTYEDLIDNSGREKNLPGIDLTPQQLFWIYFATPHCTKYATPFSNTTHATPPSKSKINGIVSSLEEFSDDFKCRSMNTDEKCNIF